MLVLFVVLVAASLVGDLVEVAAALAGTPYIGWMYIGLIVSAILLAGLLLRSSHARVWKGAALLAASVIGGYTLSRTTGLPGSTADIGNWGQSLGIASLFVEGSLIALSTAVLRSRSRLQLQARPTGRSAESLTLRAA